MNFVARRYKFRCPSFFQALPVVFYADGRENLRRRPWLFRPFFDRAIKRLLLQKANFGVLEGFLNVFLGVEKDKEEERRKDAAGMLATGIPAATIATIAGLKASFLKFEVSFS